MDIDPDVAQLEQNHTPEFQPVPTASGRQRRFPRFYQDFLPNSTTQLPHMPPKPKRTAHSSIQDTPSSPVPTEVSNTLQEAEVPSQTSSVSIVFMQHIL